MATHIVANPTGGKPAGAKLREELVEVVKDKFPDEDETQKILLEAIPSARSINEWTKKDGWNDAVWTNIKQDGLFTSQKRAEMIEALRQRGINRSDNAAKMWLTMSGDYQEKLEVDNNTVDTFREINKVLHSNKYQKED